MKQVKKLNTRKSGPKASRQFGLELPAEVEALPVLAAFAQTVAREAGFPERSRNHIQLALEEITMNILRHGSGQGSFVKIRATLGDGDLRLEVLDTGRPFGFEQAMELYNGIASPDQEIGGIGLYLVKNLMDEVHYQPGTPEGNRMTLIKNKEGM
jgi:anti-sigma regulatory factor (Ser/Thr protein kinase)